MTEIISISLASDEVVKAKVRKWTAAGKHVLSQKVRDAIRAYDEK